MFKFIDQPENANKSEEYYGKCGTGYGGSLLFQLVKRSTGRSITIAYMNSEGCIVRRELNQDEIEILTADGFKIHHKSNPSCSVMHEAQDKKKL
jgi:hypothetical protein